MEIRRGVLAALGALALAGCATPYQERGLLGGVSGTQITNDTFQVTAQGNAYTDPATIQRYVLRKAAEMTLAAGFDYFVVGDPTDQSSSAQVNSSFVGARRGKVYGFGVSQNIFKPGQTVMIKAFKGQTPDPAPMGVYNAHEVEKFLGTMNTAGHADANSDKKTCATAPDGSIKCE